ncbi:MAG: NAD(P)/FAD-dependent oxidoreductase [Microcoleaceae cyanobacterium]
MSIETKKINQNAVIIGGGPAGFATALMLAKRGWQEITVLEKRPDADFYEPDKSFNYQIDGRGQKFTDLLGLTEKLAKISVPNTEFYLTVIKANSNRKTSKLPIVDPNRKTAYWLPRQAFLQLLYQEIEQNWQHCIRVLFDTKCVGINQIITKNSDESQGEIIAQEINNENIIKFAPDLLVGCDGINSLVRETLDKWDNSGTNKFKMQFFPSPSSGLKYKVLTLPPNFPLDRNSSDRAECTMAYAIRGAFSEPQHSLSLGILPFADPNQIRTANIIRPPDHEIWNLKDGDKLYKFLETAFPQLPINEIVSPEESDRFAKSEGGYFPIPQYCSGLHWLLSDKDNSSGVVLLGDAVHCFPPDIGQGVNSALEDVCILNQALAESNDIISDALPLYESLRSSDIQPLICLAQTAFPWQYNQDIPRKRLWSINFFVRLLLSRILPFIFSPPAFILIQNHQLSYQEIWSMAEKNTKIIYVLLGLILVGSLFTLFSVLL